MGREESGHEGDERESNVPSMQDQSMIGMCGESRAGGLVRVGEAGTGERLGRASSKRSSSEFFNESGREALTFGGELGGGPGAVPLTGRGTSIEAPCDRAIVRVRERLFGDPGSPRPLSAVGEEWVTSSVCRIEGGEDEPCWKVSDLWPELESRGGPTWDTR